MSQAATQVQTVTVRDIRGADELRACQELQRTAWGITEDGYVLPVATMAAAQKVGGLILGAFDDQGLLVGFAFAFLGKLRERLILYSQLTGVHPAHQSTGVGRQLKFEQRRRAAEMGLAAVVWAFDPLQASNAAFNLAVLGATSCSYEVDLYGLRSDALNAGVATDRLIAEWSTRHTAGRSQHWSDAVELIETEPGSSGTYRVVRKTHAVPPDATHVHIEAPSNIAHVKAYGSRSTARDWQLALRETFLAAFAMGYVAVGFSRANSDQPRYLLERTA